MLVFTATEHTHTHIHIHSLSVVLLTLASLLKQWPDCVSELCMGRSHQAPGTSLAPSLCPCSRGSSVPTYDPSTFWLWVSQWTQQNSIKNNATPWLTQHPTQFPSCPASTIININWSRPNANFSFHLLCSQCSNHQCFYKQNLIWLSRKQSATKLSTLWPRKETLQQAYIFRYLKV